MEVKRKAVVTGGAGFIGSHIADELVKRGYQVIILDDLSTGRIENIQHIIGAFNDPASDLPPLERGVKTDFPLYSPQVEFIHGSITDLPLLQYLFKGIDYVFHQAAIPSVPRSIKSPSRSHETNVTGTLNVLVASRDSGVKKVIFASSSSIYGDTITLPKREDMIPSPQSPYAVTKLASEHYCNVFSITYGLPTVCLRYFNVYGPRQDPRSQYSAVIPKFIKLISEKKSPIIFGDGEQTRDFTFVKDIVQANILLAESKATGIFNIGRGERVSLNQLTDLLLKNLNGDGIKPIYEGERCGDIKHSLADITKARNLGYNPAYNVEVGIMETIRSLKWSLKQSKQQSA